MLIDADTATKLSSLRQSATKRRRLERRSDELLKLANQQPTDLKLYGEALLATYLLRSERVTVTAKQTNLDDRERMVEAVFNVDPIKLDGEQGVGGAGQRKSTIIKFNDLHLLAPLSLRDLLAGAVSGRVPIVAIGFGCLKVTYLLPHRSSGELIKSIDFTALATEIPLRSLRLAGVSLFWK